jgi:hypothetical protein
MSPKGLCVGGVVPSVMILKGDGTFRRMLHLWGHTFGIVSSWESAFVKDQEWPLLSGFLLGYMTSPSHMLSSRCHLPHCNMANGALARGQIHGLPNLGLSAS